MNRNLTKKKKVSSSSLSYLHTLTLANVSTRTLRYSRDGEDLIYCGIMVTGNGVRWKCTHIKNEKPRSSNQL